MGSLEFISRQASDYWHAAIDPLHALTWQTGTLFLMIVLALALATTWIVSISWIWPWSRKAVAQATIRQTAHTYKEPPDYLRFHRLAESLKSNMPAVVRARNRDLERYYVVTLVEHKKRAVVLYRELKLQCPMGGKYQTHRGEIQLDESLLAQVRAENSSIDDDEPDTAVGGLYDVYIRRVQWYDVRHWLLHPNREIRIVIWVTIITTTLPMLLGVLFN